MRDRVKVLVFSVLSLALAACASNGPPHVPEGMRIATAEMVGDCQLLGDVHGFSSFYGVFAKGALAAARQEAFDQAGSMGADTIVWGQFGTTYGGTSASGLAYRCGASSGDGL